MATQRTSPTAAASGATIGLTISSAALVLFGLAIGLSCERWATGRGQCHEAWLSGINAVGGGGLGLAGTWMRNPYIRREEEDISTVALNRRLPPRGLDGRFVALRNLPAEK